MVGALTHHGERCRTTPEPRRGSARHIFLRTAVNQNVKSVRWGVVLVALILSACGTKNDERIVNVSAGGPRQVLEVHRGFETICRVDGKDFPPSYRVADMGKPGVPPLEGEELQQVHAISRYVHSPTLRFQEIAAQFLVYDASLGACLLAAPGYWVLNAPRCNMYFMPADAWNGPSAVPGCYSPPRPWVPHDGGDPRIKWGDFPTAGISTPRPL